MRKIELEFEDSTVEAAGSEDRLYESPIDRFKYFNRHTAEDDTIPTTVEPSMWVNFMTDVILDKPIPEVELSGLVIVKDWGYFDE